ncbi:MAG TPA: hypothetical protein VMP11_17380 [Verrucomicrobiae bacterium]|nr:hypothetical protein [Verrucomicrobiae bacterium]
MKRIFANAVLAMSLALGFAASRADAQGTPAPTSNPSATPVSDSASNVSAIVSTNSGLDFAGFAINASRDTASEHVDTNGAASFAAGSDLLKPRPRAPETATNLNISVPVNKRFYKLDTSGSGSLAESTNLQSAPMNLTVDGVANGVTPSRHQTSGPGSAPSGASTASSAPTPDGGAPSLSEASSINRQGP